MYTDKGVFQTSKCSLSVERWERGKGEGKGKGKGKGSGLNEKRCPSLAGGRQAFLPGLEDKHDLKVRWTWGWVAGQEVVNEIQGEGNQEPKWGFSASPRQELQYAGLHVRLELKHTCQD